MIGDALSGITESPFVLLLLIAAILILTGMFLESIAQIILLTPLMLPIAVSLGIDPIVFGIIMIISCEVGFLTPPVGANLFVAARITNLGIDKISVEVIPFVIAYVIALLCKKTSPDPRSFVIAYVIALVIISANRYIASRFNLREIPRKLGSVSLDSDQIIKNTSNKIPNTTQIKFDTF